ncbi:testis-specific gene 13 protein [Macrotis lagotis]|uniref:testis-specific gene 13 protein n=1 Tax=Macrotis lagotis TaxID=92651 RepID=UPI003D68455B
MEKSDWQKANTKMQGSRPSTSSRKDSRVGAKETETSSGLETNKDLGNNGIIAWQKAKIKMQVDRPSTQKRKESRDTTRKARTSSGLENDKEISSKIDTNVWQKARIKMLVARPSTWKKETKDNTKETETPFDLENDKEVPKIGINAWQKAKIKMNITRPSALGKKRSRESTKETETPSDLENFKAVPRDIEKSTWQKARIVMQIIRPSTWKRNEARDQDDKETKTFELENGKEVPSKMGENGWQKPNVKMQGTRFSTVLSQDSGDSAKETKTPSGLKNGRKVHRKMVRSGWQKAKMNMKVSRSTTWKRKESRNSSKDIEISPAMKFSREIHAKVVGDKKWQHSSIWVARPSIWKSPEQLYNTKSRSDGLKRERKTRKCWLKATKAMQIMRSTKDRSFLGEGDEGVSNFVLENCEYYSKHPNLIQYYEPIKVTEPYKLFMRKQKIKRFVSRVAEFDQNKTLLIMTNNPPPSPVNWEGKESIPYYFSQELLAQPQKQLKTTSHTGLPLMKKKLKAELRAPFPVVILEDAKPKREQWYRFSTKADFKGEAKFSKLHALKKQEEEYPELSFVPDFSSDAAAARRRKVSMATWEPLTLDALLEEKPVLALPVAAQSPFRYGKAPQWLVRGAAAP